jgi:hypothetical protein
MGSLKTRGLEGVNILGLLAKNSQDVNTPRRRTQKRQTARQTLKRKIPNSILSKLKSKFHN